MGIRRGWNAIYVSRMLGRPAWDKSAGLRSTGKSRALVMTKQLALPAEPLRRQVDVGQVT